MGKVGGRLGIGNTCTPVADSCCCVAKPIQYCKVITIIIKFKKKICFFNSLAFSMI